MRFLFDANMPRSAVRVALARGHLVEHANDVGLSSASDDKVAGHAVAVGAVLVSRDLDFANTQRFPPTERHGVIVMRLPDDASANVIARVLDRFLASAELVRRIPGHLVIVELDRARFRPALPAGG